MWKTWNNAQMIVKLRGLIRVDNDVNESDITATSHYKWVLFVNSLLIISSLLSEMNNRNNNLESQVWTFLSFTLTGFRTGSKYECFPVSQMYAWDTHFRSWWCKRSSKNPWIGYFRYECRNSFIFEEKFNGVHEGSIDWSMKLHNPRLLYIQTVFGYNRNNNLSSWMSQFFYTLFLFRIILVNGMWTGYENSWTAS